ncbi:putative metal-binding motif-containing protein [Candidatus Poribacteria bacterium]|nr:putative metal-binding motif-containing protein [Candidatus Poribacteria bacterium]
MGDDGTGSAAQQFPVIMSAPAPSTPGFYTWSAAWFGNAFDVNFFNNSQHKEEKVSTNQFEVIAPPPVCADADKDGYQDSGCNADPAKGGGDCDDTNPAVNPAAVEVCNDGIDNDCNGLIDSGDTDCTMFILAPGNGSHLTSPPTFMWSAGGNNRFKAEFSYDPLFGSIVWATPVLSTTSYTMSASTWSKAPSNKQIFWRVRGANINVTPIVVQTGPEVATFWKN